MRLAELWPGDAERKCCEGPAPLSHYSEEEYTDMRDSVLTALEGQVNELLQPVDPKLVELKMKNYIKDAAGKAGNGPGARSKGAKKRKDLIVSMGACICNGTELPSVTLKPLIARRSQQRGQVSRRPSSAAATAAAAAGAAAASATVSIISSRTRHRWPSARCGKRQSRRAHHQSAVPAHQLAHWHFPACAGS